MQYELLHLYSWLLQIPVTKKHVKKIFYKATKSAHLGVTSIHRLSIRRLRVVPIFPKGQLQIYTDSLCVH